MENFLESLNKIIEQKYNLSKFIRNPLYKGMKREDSIKNLLKDLLPQFFLVGSGEIIDSKSKRSKQEDLVIYNTLTSIFKFEELEVYPADSVCAVIEVKSDLNKSKLKDALLKIHSVKKLDIVIEPAYMGDWNKKILGNIFSFNSVSLEQIKKDLFELKKELKLSDIEMPDNICVFGKYLITNNKYLKKHMNCADDYLFLKLENKTFLMFLDILIANMNKPIGCPPIFIKYFGDFNFQYLKLEKFIEDKNAKDKENNKEIKCPHPL